MPARVVARFAHRLPAMEPDMERQLIAYLLLALLIGGAAAAFGYFRYHSHERTYLRRQLREQKAYAKLMADKDGG